MTGGEREIMGGADQKGNDPAPMLQLIIIGPDPGDEGFQGQVTQDQTHQKSVSHGKTGFPGLRFDHQQNGADDPENAAVAQMGDQGHQLVQQGTAEVGGDPIEHGQIKMFGKKRKTGNEHKLPP